jgi:hypothetical protein
MQDTPTAATLLAAARQVLLDSVLPALPDERRRDALMIANAIAIAGRGLTMGEDSLRVERVELEALLGAASAATELENQVRDLNCRLGADIRRGDYDVEDGRRKAVGKFLHDSTVRKLRESNPKHLEKEGLGLDEDSGRGDEGRQ